MTLRLENVGFDCRNAGAVGGFWSEVFGVPLQGPDPEATEPVFWIQPGGGLPELWFMEVPEPKTVKNRVHLDLRPDDQEREVTRLEALGARRVDIGQRDVSWVVLADIEGNEFCVLRSRPE